MLKTRLQHFCFFSLINLFFISGVDVLASVNFIHTDENLYLTMYVKEKKVYLLRCNPQTSANFDENCDTIYQAKSIESLETYLNKLNFPTGSFVKNEASKITLEKAIAEATKLGMEGNAKAKAKVSELNKYLDNLNIVMDYKNKLTMTPVGDEAPHVLFDFSPNFKSFLEPFESLNFDKIDRDPEASLIVDKIPDFTQEQFIENFNKGIPMTMDEIPEGVFIKGKQTKFLHYNYEVGYHGQIYKSPKRQYQKLPKPWTKKTHVMFFNQHSPEFSGQKINFLPSIDDPDDFEKMNNIYNVLPLEIKEDDKGVTFFKDVVDSASLDYRCPLNLKVRKVKKENRSHSFVLIWMEAVDAPEVGSGLCTSVVPSNLTNLIFGFVGAIKN